MIGIELAVEAKPVQDYCLQNGVIINCIQGNIVRLVPPLNISYVELEQGLSVIYNALEKLEV